MREGKFLCVVVDRDAWNHIIDESINLLVN